MSNHPSASKVASAPVQAGLLEAGQDLNELANRVERLGVLFESIVYFANNTSVANAPSLTFALAQIGQQLAKGMVGDIEKILTAVEASFSVVSGGEHA